MQERFFTYVSTTMALVARWGETNRQTKIHTRELFTLCLNY
jgi:hypothetical protein